MKVFKTLFLFSALLLCSERLKAAGNETQDLYQLASKLKQVEEYLEQDDVPRMSIFKNAVLKVEESIKANGLAHMTTLRAYQGLIVRFRYSSAYFQRVESASTRPMLKEALALVEKISRDRGFDDSPYTQITAEVFSEVKVVLDQIKASSSTEVREAIDGLLEELGSTIAQGKQGDRPKTFKAGTALQKRISKLMPLIESESRKANFAEISLNLRGLLEFYGEYAQMEEEEASEVP
jgi:hypothetical protein